MNILIRAFQALVVAIFLAVISIYIFWTPIPIEPAYEFVSTWGKKGINAGEFRDPTGLAATETELFVSDSRNGRIQVFDHDGNFLRQFGNMRKPNEKIGARLKRPMNLAISNNQLYVADYWQDKIFVYSLDGQFLRSIGEAGDGPGQFNSPGGIAVTSNGDLYVADFYNQRVQHLTNEGDFIRQWGTTGKVGIFNGEFNYPTDVAVASNGEVFIADGYNDRVQVFSKDGKFVTKWGGPLALNIKGSLNGWFRTISSIDIDDNNLVYTADFYNNRVQVFTTDGKLVNLFGEAGDTAHQFDLVVAIAPAKNRTIFVSDFGHNRIQKWQLTQ